jgi:hypothetical protein
MCADKGAKSKPRMLMGAFEGFLSPSMLTVSIITSTRLYGIDKEL